MFPFILKSNVALTLKMGRVRAVHFVALDALVRFLLSPLQQCFRQVAGVVCSRSRGVAAEPVCVAPRADGGA